MKITKMFENEKALEIEPTTPLRNILDIPVEEHLRASKIAIKKRD